MTLAAAVIFLLPPLYMTALADAGSVRLSLTKVGLVFGIGGGSGTLNFRGGVYQLAFGGLSVGTIGASGAMLEGTAENLRTVNDIAGLYRAVSASAAIAAGEKVAVLKNDKGVVLRLRGRQIGVEAALGLSGLKLFLK
jgi:hypothetical protein